MSKESRDIEAELRSTDPDALYSTLIYIGKQRLRQYRSVVEPYLTNEDSGLRKAAIYDLAFYWRLP